MITLKVTCIPTTLHTDAQFSYNNNVKKDLQASICNIFLSYVFTGPRFRAPTLKGKREMRRKLTRFT